MDKKQVEVQLASRMATAMALEVADLASVPKSGGVEVPPDVVMTLRDGKRVGIEIRGWSTESRARYHALVRTTWERTQDALAASPRAGQAVTLTPRFELYQVDVKASAAAMVSLIEAGGDFGAGGQMLPSELAWVDQLSVPGIAAPAGASPFLHWRVFWTTEFSQDELLVQELADIVSAKGAKLPSWVGSYDERWLLIPSDDPRVAGAGAEQWIANHEVSAVQKGLSPKPFDRVVLYGAGLPGSVFTV